MKTKMILALFVLLGIAGSTLGYESGGRFQKADTYLRDNRMDLTTTIEQAFVQEIVLVSGEGVPKKGTTGAQKRLTAITAAKTVAQRRLLEMLEGVSLVAETTVRDHQRTSEVVKTAVSGFVRGARVVVEDWNEGDESALVILSVGLNGPKGFAALMYDKIMNEAGIRKELQRPAYLLVSPVAPSSEPYDGLIIDARDYAFRPALINRIFTAKGEVLYDPSKISQKILVEQGCGEYTTSVDKARAALGTRGVRNPLIVKASGTLSPSDLHVTDIAAGEIFSANQTSGFMAGAKVAFVLR
jgi:hypothetical protein